jgi:hypothetical protein
MADNVAITAGSGTNIAADDVSSVLYQRIKRSVGADGSATDFLDKSSRSDTYTTTANGTAVDVSAQGMSQFAIQCKATGSVTSWTVVLEASLDGTNYVTVLTCDSVADGDGAIVWTGPQRYPALYFRSRCSAITLGAGTNVIATIVGTP